MPGFGLLRVKDPRDKNYQIRMLLRPTAYPAYRYYRVPDTMPLNQGETGTCTAHSAVGFELCAPMMTLTPDDPFDLYRETVGSDEFTENDFEVNAPVDELQSGTTVRATVQTMRRRGRIKNFVWANNADDAAAWLLLSKGTIMFGTDWHYGMSDLDSKFYANLTGGVAGGHAYLCIGYSRVLKAFRCINSWGPTFGQHGRFWIRHDDMNKLMRANGEACAAVEQKLILPVAA